MHHVDDPATMTPEERATEVAAILARGILRLRKRNVRASGQVSAEKRDFSVGWTLTIRTVPLASVRIQDRTGVEVFSGRTDEKGQAAVPLLQYTQTPEGRTDLTPHQITVQKDGKTADRTVTIDRKQEIEIKP